MNFIKKSLSNFKFTKCLSLGIWSNVCFIVFIIVCIVYYELFQFYHETNIVFELLAYCLETLGFLFMFFSIILITFKVDIPKFPRFLMLTYLVTEVAIMLFDFGFINANWYDGYNKTFIVCHIIFSGIVMLCYLLFDRDSKSYRRIVGIATCICFFAFFISVGLGYSIYSSVLINCFAYLFLYISMKILLHLEYLDIKFFDTPIMVSEFSMLDLDLGNPYKSDDIYEIMDSHEDKKTTHSHEDKK